MTAPGLMMRTDGAVRILVNSNPAAKNAITPALYDALPAALDQAAQDPAFSAPVATCASWPRAARWRRTSDAKRSNVCTTWCARCVHARSR
jgi:hypothetical protein